MTTHFNVRHLMNFLSIHEAPLPFLSDVGFLPPEHVGSHRQYGRNYHNLIINLIFKISSHLIHISSQSLKYFHEIIYSRITIAYTNV